MRRFKKAALKFAVVPLSEVPVAVPPGEAKKSPASEFSGSQVKPRNRSTLRLDTPAKWGTLR